VWQADVTLWQQPSKSLVTSADASGPGRSGGKSNGPGIVRGAVQCVGRPGSSAAEAIGVVSCGGLDHLWVGLQLQQRFQFTYRIDVVW
jgi:hypothetical protein